MAMPTVHAPHIAASSRPRPRPLFRLDAGWLFLIAGLAVVSATILIPASLDLSESRWQKDKALAIERHRQTRLERYGQYLAAVQRGDDDLMLSLMATQLNMSPAARVPLMPPEDPRAVSASPFPGLEPEPIDLPERPAWESNPSLLVRLTTNDRHRLWMLASGAVCILIGVLPTIGAAGRR